MAKPAPGRVRPCRTGHTPTVPRPKARPRRGTFFAHQIKYMFQKLTSWENLLQSFRKAGKKKRRRPDVAAFEYRLEENLLDLQSQLRDKTYLPGRYRSFHIFDPKERFISAAPFRDRVVHHALCRTVNPVFEKSFISDSYANRKDKGTHRALDRCQQLCRKFKYVLPCDLEQYFPSIDHKILLETLGKRIRDPDVMWLVERIVEKRRRGPGSPIPRGVLPRRRHVRHHKAPGLPIGNLTSQLWANAYLDPFDHFVKRQLRCPGYVRYVDDFLLFGDDKAELGRHLQSLTRRLQRFRATVHPTCVRPCSEGIPFLGFVVYRDKRRLKRRKVVQFKRKYKEMRKQCQEGKIAPKAFTASVRAWANHSCYGNAAGLRKAILEPDFLIGQVHGRENFAVLKPAILSRGFPAGDLLL